MTMSWVEYLEEAAKKSHWDLGLWVRYLNKVIQRNQIFLSSSDVVNLLHSNCLKSYQKVFLKLALEKGTKPWELVIGYSEASKLNHLNSVLKNEVEKIL